MHAIRETVVWETTGPLQLCRFFLETAFNIDYQTPLSCIQKATFVDYETN